MNVAPFFGQKATFEQQFDNPGAWLRPQPSPSVVRGDLFRSYPARNGNSGHRGKQCRIGEMTRKGWLGARTTFPFHTATHHLYDNRQRHRRFPVALYCPVRPANRPARKTRFWRQISFGDFQFNNAFTKTPRPRTASDNDAQSGCTLSLRFPSDGQKNCAADNRVVRIHFLSSQQRLRVSGLTTDCGSKFGADANRDRLPSGKVFFRQITAVGTRIGNQFVGFI